MDLFIAVEYVWSTNRISCGKLGWLIKVFPDIFISFSLGFMINILNPSIGFVKFFLVINA